MRYIDRDGITDISDSSQDKLLKALYTNTVGRALIKLLVNPVVSEIGGKILSTKLSALSVNGFIKKNNIDMSDYEPTEYMSFNDFFTRKIADGKRTVDMDAKALIAPCDSKLSVYKISEDEPTVLTIKDTPYTVESLLRDKKLAKKYAGGYGMVFRLTVNDYHRYCYVDNGIKSSNRTINGVFHTVNPIANDVEPIYKENTREYCQIRTKNFGDILMMEVGALMVGKIVNYHDKANVTKGMEKGRFEFGGSTIIMLCQKDKVVIDKDILNNTQNGYETVVKMGMKIGTSK